MRRAIRALLLSALAMALIAPATSVAGTAGATVYVDDDGTASATSCDGVAAAPTSLQAAVDSVGKGSTIWVCPGTYPGPTLIKGPGKNGLTVRATERWKAVITAPEVDLDHLVRIQGTERVTIRALRFRIGAAPDPCEDVDDVIVIRSAQQTRVLANRIVAKGTATRDCGYGTGIDVGADFDRTASTAIIAWNIIQDFRSSGIELCRAGRTRILRNSIRYFHATEPAGDLTFGKGIHANDCSGSIPTWRILDNVIRTLDTAGDTTPALREGIWAACCTEELTGNRISGAETGIFVESRDASPIASRNTVHALAGEWLFSTGIRVNSVDDPNQVRDNIVSGFARGVRTQGGGGDTIADNDLAANTTPCLDGSSGLNTWTNNLGCLGGPEFED